MVETGKNVPVKEGLYKIPTSQEEEGYLIGSRCKSCGNYFHPPRQICVNCYSEDSEEISLSTKGKIWAYTIARQTVPGTPLTAPYIIGQVKLPEEVVVSSLITDCDLEAVRIGMDVKLYFWKVREDAEGNEVIAYAFKPQQS